jgi:transposase
MTWTVAIGVDTHRDWHVAFALDQLGRPLGSLRVTVSEDGFAELKAFAEALGHPAFVIEGTGCYGASLTRSLLADGFEVYECERPERRSRRNKNDLLDAERAAKRLLSGEPLALPRLGGERELLRLLLVERRSCHHARRQALNQLAAAIVTLDPPVRATLERVRPQQILSRLQGNPALTPLRRLAQRTLHLDDELAELDAELTDITRRLCPQLLAEHGVGPICAAQILVSSAQPHRIRHEASFAALAGVSPIEASSGPTKRHRLNRGGDRQLNWAIHMTALTRIRNHPETQAYYQRLQARGKTKREAIRCIKRAIARRLYQTVTAHATA